ncbi:MAG: hypothetical protein ACJA2S_001110 [Cyclobacteriaceae bacterium]|jgi:hypothetical protein
MKEYSGTSDSFNGLVVTFEKVRLGEINVSFKGG